MLTEYPQAVHGGDISAPRGGADVLTCQRVSDVDSAQMARGWSLDRLQLTLLQPGRWNIRMAPSDLNEAMLVLLSIGAPAHAEAPGSRVAVDAGSIYVRAYTPGELVSLDVEGEVAVVFIPSVLAGLWYYGMRRRRPVVIDARAGVPSVVAHLIEMLTRDRGVCTQTDSPVHLAQHVVGLISLACNEAADESGGGVSDLLQQAMEYIDLRLGDMSLTPDRIAEAVCVSTRTLHRLFEREGLTVSAWIRQCRLENCRIELTDPRMRNYSVSAIGARWGLSDAAHFSRLFKATYGVSPRAFRAGHLRRGEDAALAGQLRTA